MPSNCGAVMGPPRAFSVQYHCNVAVILHRMKEAVKPAGLRAVHVAQNEERILRAARELFVRDGYQATTLAAVADRTVYVRFGTKAALLKRVIDVAIVGDLAPIDVVNREWYRTATTAPTLAARIEAFAEGSARLMASAAEVIAVAREAEPSEPLLAAAARAGKAATRDAIRTFWTRARDDGLLAAGADVTWLADTTSVLAHAETYLLMRETLQLTPM